MNLAAGSALIHLIISISSGKISATLAVRESGTMAVTVYANQRFLLHLHPGDVGTGKRSTEWLNTIIKWRVSRNG